MWDIFAEMVLPSPASPARNRGIPAMAYSMTKIFPAVVWGTTFPYPETINRRERCLTMRRPFLGGAAERGISYSGVIVIVVLVVAVHPMWTGPKFQVSPPTPRLDYLITCSEPYGPHHPNPGFGCAYWWVPTNPNVDNLNSWLINSRWYTKSRFLMC